VARKILIKEYIKRRRKKKAKQHTSDGCEFQTPHSNAIYKRFCSDATPVPSKINPQEESKGGAEIDPLYVGYLKFFRTKRHCVNKLKHQACTAKYSYPK
jgi:hypothetical protein